MRSVLEQTNSAISYRRYSGHQTIATGPREEGNQETDGEGKEEGRHACGQTGTRNAREEVFLLFTLAVSLVVRSKGAILFLDGALSRASPLVFLT